MKIGDKVVIVRDWSDFSSLTRGIVSAVGKDTVTVNDQIYYSAFVFPQIASSEIEAVVLRREALKRAFDDSMSLVYNLNHKKAKGEYD